MAFGEGRANLPTVKEMVVDKPYNGWKVMQDGFD
jgi:hypothetical protein